MNESIATGELYYLIEEKIVNCHKLRISEIAELIDQLDGIVVHDRHGVDATTYTAEEMAAMPTGQFAGLLQHLVSANIDGRISSPHREILDELAENVTKGEIDEVIHHIEPVDDRVKTVDPSVYRTREENQDVANLTMRTLADEFSRSLVDYAHELNDMGLSIHNRIFEVYHRIQSQMETVFRTIDENHPREIQGTGEGLTLVGLRGSLAKKDFLWEISEKDASTIKSLIEFSRNPLLLRGIVLDNIGQEQVQRLLSSTTSPVPAEVRALAASPSFDADDYLLIYHVTLHD